MPKVRAYGKIINFPDGMSHDDIAAAIRKNERHINPDYELTVMDRVGDAASGAWDSYQALNEKSRKYLGISNKSIADRAEETADESENRAAPEVRGAPVRQSTYNQALADPSFGLPKKDNSPVARKPDRGGILGRMRTAADEDIEGKKFQGKMGRAITDEATDEELTPEALDYAKGFAAGSNKLLSGVGYIAEELGADNVGRTLRETGDYGAEYWNSRMSPGGKKAAGAELFEDDPDSITGLKLTDKSGVLLMGVSQSLPSMAVGGAAGGLLAKGIQKAAPYALMKLGLGGGAGATIPLLAGTASPIGLTSQVISRSPSAIGFGASEGLLAGGMGAAQLKSSIEGMPEEEISKSPVYQVLKAQHGAEKARAMLSEQAASDLFGQTAGAVGAISALTGGGALGQAYQKITTGSKDGLIKTALKGAASEGAQETPQSGAEKYIENITGQKYLDPSINPTEGVLASALSGGAIGAVMGGVVGAGSKINITNKSRQAIERERARAEKLRTDIDNIGQAKTVDDAINAAAEAVLKTEDPTLSDITNLITPAGTPPGGAGGSAIPTQGQDENILFPTTQNQPQGVTNEEKTNTETSANTAPKNPGVLGRAGLISVDSFSSGKSKGLTGSEPVPLKDLSDQPGADIQFIGNLSRAKTFQEKGLDALDGNAQLVVMGVMNKAVHDKKILDSVVRLIPVDVVADLRSKQLTPEMLFHNPSMLFDSNFRGDSNSSVPLNVRAANAAIKAIATVGAKNSSAFVPGDLGSTSGKTGTASGTIDNRHDITPNSSVVTGAEDASTSSVPPIIPNIKPGKSTKIVLPDGTRLSARWEIVDADQVKASLKSGKNQPRDRERAASNIQINSIANNLDYLRLSDSPVLDVGSPTIGHGGEIVGGNGRFEAINQAHENGQAQSYREHLLADAANKGIDSSQIAGMKKPVLVRRITQPFDTRQLAIASNSGTSAGYSGLEQAKLDSERMGDLENITLTDGGDIALTGENVASLRKSLAGYGPAEVGDFIDQGGVLSQGGMKRVKNALLAKAYGATQTLGRLIESVSEEMRNIQGALMKSAAVVAKTRSEIAGGAVPQELDVTENILEAVETLAQIRSKNQPLENFLAQENVFDDGLDQDSQEILKFLHENIRSQRKLTDFIKELYTQIGRVDISTEDVFGDNQIPTKRELIANAKKTTESSQETGADPAKAAKTEGNDAAGSEKSQLSRTPQEKLKDNERRKKLERILNKPGRQFKIEAADLRNDIVNEGREEEAGIAERVARFFGKRIVWIKADNDAEINGVVVTSAMPDAIFIDVRTKNYYHAIMGHELSHHMEKDAPDVYREMVKALMPLIRNMEQYRDQVEDPDMADIDVLKEIVGDLVGDNFTKPKFWNQVAQNNPGAFKRIADSILSWLKNLITRAKKQGLGSEKWVTDIQKAQDIIAKAVAQYTTQGQGSEQDGAAQFHKAWHGSPHDHNKFDSGKIGTGDGQKSYGYGHYFADKKAIAESYKETLGKKTRTYTIDGKAVDIDSLDPITADALRATAQPELYGKTVENWEDNGVSQEAIDQLEAKIAELQGRTAYSEVNRGKLYQVDLKPTEKDYLLWDKPLSEQSEKVKAALEDYVVFNPSGPVAEALSEMQNGAGTGRSIQRAFVREARREMRTEGKGLENDGAEKKASEMMRFLGIRGIKYLQADSPLKGEESFNYVVFDDNDIEITAKFSKAFHGSPHDFDKFSSSRIGTGDGNAAYGHGLYFADTKEIAEHYKNTLSDNTNGPPSRFFKGQLLTPGTPEYHAATLVSKPGARLARVRKEVEGWIEEAANDPAMKREVAGYRKTLEILNQAKFKEDFKEVPYQGKLYEVELAPEQEDYLLWDKPLSEQSEKVRSIIQSTARYKKSKARDADKIARGYPTIDQLPGKHIYQNIFGDVGDGYKDTSKYLHKLGIRGIKYLDGSSRAKEKGSYNYVIFNDKDITVTAKFSKTVKAKDKEYIAAVKNGDLETAQKMVDEKARESGYISGTDYRMMHQAPNREDYNLATIKEAGIVPDDYWTHPHYYQSDPTERDSFYFVKSAIERQERTGRKLVGMVIYRSVPKDVKDDNIRNGDWVTPSREYAKLEGESIPGGYRIIAQRALLKDLWWDANSINELGYDDGKSYAYKNTKNNRKLIDAVTYDDDGNIIPLSKRFNSRSDDVKFSKAKKSPAIETITVDGVERPTTNSEGKPIHATEEGIRAFYEWFGSSTVTDSSDRPLVVYHATDKDFNSFKENGNEIGIHFGTKNAANNVAEFRAKKNPAHIIPVYLKINKILRTNDPIYWQGSDVVHAIKSSDQSIEVKQSKYLGAPFYKLEDIKSGLEASGYDGIVYKNDKEDNGSDSYLVINPNQIKSAISNTGAFSAENDDIRFSFAGRRAKTADLYNLHTAEERLAKGENRETVRRETGWFKNNPDGKWRFEINDSDAKLINPPTMESFETFYRKKEIERYGRGHINVSGMKAAEFKKYQKFRSDMDAEYEKSNSSHRTLGSLLDHPKLFAAYPELKNYDVFHDPSLGETASFHRESNQIRIGDSSNLEGFKSVLLHEIQHGIQNIEGFARGGNPDGMSYMARKVAEKIEETGKPQKALDALSEAKVATYARLAKEWRRNPETLRRYQDWLAVKGFFVPKKNSPEYGPYMEEKVEKAIDGLKMAIEGWEWPDFDQAMRKPIAELKRISRNAWRRYERVAGDLGKFQNFMEIVNNDDPKKAYEFYERLAGEMEARNVQSRMNLSDAERMERSPESTQDRKNSDAIVIFNGDVMKNAPPPANAQFSRAIPETININGVERPTRNSEGKLIHPTIEGIEKFYDWFSDSKVLDKEGRPMVMYHATGNDFDEFRAGSRGSIYFATTSKGAEQGAKASSNESYAGGSGPSLVMPVYIKASHISGLEFSKKWAEIAEKLPQTWSDTEYNAYVTDENTTGLEGRIASLAYKETDNKDGSFTLNKELPYLPLAEVLKTGRDLNGSIPNWGTWTDERWASKNMRENGADGMLVRDEAGISLAVLDPGQIKSAVGNNGEFSSDTDKIQFSRAKRDQADSPAPVTRIAQADDDRDRQMQEDIPDTIEIDGVERPTKNSEGKLIHPTEEGIRKFYDWFSDSKVLDQDGKPLVVYHGTSSDFDTFDSSKVGTGSGSYSGKGFYFTPDIAEAGGWAEMQGDNPSVMPVYLKLSKPNTFFLSHGNWQAGDNFAQELQDQGFDGVIVKGRDTDPDTDKIVDEWINELVAFKPNQIKSAVGNTGAFSKDTDKIQFSRAPSQTPPKETAFRKFQRTHQDKFNRFTVIKEWLAEHGVNLSEKADVHAAEERYHSMVANQIEDFNKNIRNPLIEEIAKSDYTMADVADYLEAQHAPERNAYVQKLENDPNLTGYGISDADAAAYLAKAPAALKKLADKMRDIVEKTRKLKKDNGLVVNDDPFQFYVPTFGDTAPGFARGFRGRFRPANTLSHDKRDEKVIENIFHEFERAVLEVENNRVRKHVAMMAAEIARPDLMTVNVPEKRKVIHNKRAYEVRVKGVLRQVFKNMNDAVTYKNNLPAMNKKINANDISIHTTTDQRVIESVSPQLADNEIYAYIDGHEVRIQIKDPLMAGALAQLGVENFGKLVAAGKMVNGYLSSVYTGYSPEFITTNIQRDFSAGLVNITGEEGAFMALKAIKNYPGAFLSMLRYAISDGKKSDRWIDSYRANGGNTGAAYLSDMERLGTEVAREYASYQGIIANLKQGDMANAARSAGRRVFNALLKWMSWMNIASENAMRLAVFKAMINSGKTVNQASRIAKNVTVNFNRKGEATNTTNALYLFLNAGTQGTASLAHALFKGKHKYQAWAMASGLMTLFYMAVSSMLAGDDDDEYAKIDDNTKSRNLLIKTEDGYVKIPIGYGLGFFSNLGRMFAEAQHTGEWGNLPWHIAALAIEEFTPFGDTVVSEHGEFRSEQVILGILPTVPKTALQIGFNYDAMSGRGIMPDSEYDPDKPERERMNRGTEGTMYDKVAGWLEMAGFDVSPEILKFTNRTLTGGTGTFADTTATGAYLKSEGAELETKEIPFVRKSFMEIGIQGDRAAYYKAREEAAKTAREFSRAKQKNDFTTMQKLMKDKREMLALDKHADALQKYIKVARTRQDDVRKSDLPIAEKRLKLKELEANEKRFYDNYLDVFKTKKLEMKERQAAAVNE